MSLLLASVILGSAFANPLNNARLTVPNNKIINGEDAKKGEFPFMASIRFIEGNKHYCSGTILTKNWILTAAHCCKADGKRSFYTTSFVITGSIYLSSGGTNHTIEDIIPHEDHEEDDFKHDICLIRLKNSIEFNKNVYQVTLPSKNFFIYSGDGLVSTGWGKTENNTDLPDRLQKLTTYVGLLHEECIEETTILDLFPGFICARTESKHQGICFGDSGGPLLKNDVQVGITSFIFLPCGSVTPDIFIRVSYYITWIKEKLGIESLELKFSI